MNIIIYEKNIKHTNLQDIKKQYLDRIKKYCNIKIINNKFTRTNKDYIINISRNTSSISSIDFAKKISDLLINGYSNIIFIRDKNLCKNYDYNLSISNLDVSYEMEAILLLEQIYRAFKINNNEVYHK